MNARPAPAAQGNLARTPFAHVLLYVREHRLTGTLAIRSGPAGGDLAGESLLAFEEGALAQIKLPKPHDTLGSLLREQGAITEDQLQESLGRLNAREGLQGEILIAMGACDADAIERALREQVRRKALRLFNLHDAPYQYYDRCDLLEGYGRTRYPEDLLAIVWRGVKARPGSPAVEAVMSRATGAALRLRVGLDLGPFEFGRAEAPILEALRLGTEVPTERLLRIAPDEGLARALLYVLVVSKHAEIVPADPQAGMRSATGSHAAVSARATPHASVPPEPTARSSPPAVSTRASVAPGTRQHDSRSALAALPPELQGKATEAMRRLAAMQDETYFQMLGVPTTASADAVRAAFMDLAARWHPDRVPAGAPALRALYQDIFALLNEAHTTLCDNEARGRYLRTVQDGGGTPNAQRKVAQLIEAATDVQKAEVCLRVRDYAEAERLARKALAVTPDDPNTLAVLASVLLEKKGEPAALAEAERLLLHAVESAPKHDKAHVMLGGIYKRKGDAARALTHFRQALEANPKNLDAAREVRLAEMRERGTTGRHTVANNGDESKGGFLSKLLKR